MTAYGTVLMPKARPVAENLAERNFFSQFRLPIADNGVTFWLTKTGQNRLPLLQRTSQQLMNLTSLTSSKQQKRGKIEGVVRWWIPQRGSDDTNAEHDRANTRGMIL